MEPGKDCCMVAESTHLKFRIAAEHVAIFSSPSAEPAPIAAVSPFKIKNKSFERTVAEGPIEVKVVAQSFVWHCVKSFIPLYLQLNTE